MKIIKPGIMFIEEIDGDYILRKIEKMGRICYQSEPKGEPEKFVGNLVKRGHDSVLEHVQLSFIVTTDRGVLAEWTRHRIASYSVESTRYCNYKGDDIEFIEPIEMKDNDQLYALWVNACQNVEERYNDMINAGAKPQEARSVLDMSLRTMMGISMNLRSLRNFFRLRCDKAAHPHIKELAIPLLLFFKERIPVVFDDIGYDEEFYEKYMKGSYKEYIIYDKENFI